MTKDGLPEKHESPTASLAVHPSAQAVMRWQLPLVVLSSQLYIAPGVQLKACVEPPHMLPFTGYPRMFSEVQLCATVLIAALTSPCAWGLNSSCASHAARRAAIQTANERTELFNGSSMSSQLSSTPRLAGHGYGFSYKPSPCGRDT
jgi:hypothetical protein